jgi:hypothetical protein
VRSGPSVELASQRAVLVGEERPVAVAAVGHQSPWNSGRRLSRNAR